jgi:hypothetical protein
MTPQPLALALFIFHLADLTEPLHLIGLAFFAICHKSQPLTSIKTV